MVLSATGQGVSNAKLSVYRYMAYYNAVNAKKDVLNLDTPDDLNDRIDQLSPNDNDLRTTTFKITSLSKAPKVELVKGQRGHGSEAAIRASGCFLRSADQDGNDHGQNKRMDRVQGIRSRI